MLHSSYTIVRVPPPQYKYCTPLGVTYNCCNIFLSLSHFSLVFLLSHNTTVYI